jgi:hypothetical protein
LFPRVVSRVYVFKAERSDRRYLGDILTGSCPVEVGRIAGQDDNAARRIRGQLLAVELIAQADVETPDITV